jgi:hypothetical protein
LITYNENELHIPKEFLKIYQTKITAWETLKQSLFTLDPTTAKTELKNGYQNYHDYFENMYMAMLMEISTFSNNITSSNNLDSAKYLQHVDYFSAQLGTIAIKDGVITGPIELMTEEQRKLFYGAIQTKKIDGKTIIELAKSSVDTDKDKAIRAVKQIVKSILEAQMLSFDTKGNMIFISYGSNKIGDL